MAWIDVIYPIMTHFRKRRLVKLLELYPDLATYSVLDVGGRPFIWELLKKHYQVEPQRLVLLNSPDDNLLNTVPGYTVEFGDGCDLSYADNSFDLVFSNSVIEHVGDLARMTQFAQECDRVGKQLYIQTPNRWFPLEAHFGAAFVHWLPRAWYRRFSFLSVRYLFTFNNPDERHNYEKAFENTDLLSLKEMRSLFPTKTLIREKVLGLTKSLIVMSSWV